MKHNIMHSKINKYSTWILLLTPGFTIWSLIRQKECVIVGKCTLENRSQWFLSKIMLNCTNENSIKYLGAILSSKSHDHIEMRFKACIRAFYAVQGVVCITLVLAQVLYHINYLENCSSACVDI